MAANLQSDVECDATFLPLVLTQPQRAALWQLGSRGSGASFDPLAMSALYSLGLVEVRNSDRHVVLTDRGRIALTGLDSAGCSQFE